jgi:NADH-quinone oxidoreductase subunit B
VGESFITSRVDALLNWAWRSSLQPFPFAHSCCGAEVEAAMGGRFDLESRGCALPRFAPRHADLLLVAGTLSRRQAPVLQKVYAQMSRPKWVIAVGACACSGGPYANYATTAGVAGIVPVDVFVEGCPPSPEAILAGVRRLQRQIGPEPGASPNPARDPSQPIG